MLSHYRKRADECALRIVETKSEKLRQDYRRLFDAWMDLIRAEEERLTRPVHLSHPRVRSG